MPSNPLRCLQQPVANVTLPAAGAIPARRAGRDLLDLFGSSGVAASPSGGNIARPRRRSTFATGCQAILRPQTTGPLLAGALLALTATAPLASDVLTLVSINEESGGFFGESVAGIPDVDGDGLDDVIIGAGEEDGGGVSDAGRVYIHSGATGALIRAHSSPDDTVEGAFGFAVAGIPDVTGDGRGDYLVGAPGEDGGRGRAYLYSGASGALVRTVVSPNDEIGGSFGRTLAGLDDLTADGRGDYAIGAPNENGARGRVYVFSGQTGNLVRTHNSPNAEPNGLFGFAVAAVPDADGDGRGDYVVGAPQEDPGAAPSNSGRAYLYAGINGSLRFTLASSNPEVQGQFGYAVAGTPDLGGNGSGDVIVGAPFETVSEDGVDYSDAGRAYVFSGTSGGLAKVLSSPWWDLEDGNLFGRAVAGVENLAGLGLGGLLVGAPGWPGPSVYLFGGAGSYSFLSDIDSPDATGASQFFGGALAMAGDLNGDGLGDFIIGARGADEFPAGPSESGRAFLHRFTPPNDQCVELGLVELVDGANPFTNIGAGGDGDGAGGLCTVSLQSDVWFRYTATCTGTLVFSTCDDASFNTVIAVHDGCEFVTVRSLSVCVIDGPPLACSNDFGGCGANTSRVSLHAEAGECFLVQVGGFFGDQGTGVLTVSCLVCPADLDADGEVDGADVGLLLSQWGGPGSGDLDGDGEVDGADLGMLLGAWGEC